MPSQTREGLQIVLKELIGYDLGGGGLGGGFGVQAIVRVDGGAGVGVQVVVSAG